MRTIRDKDSDGARARSRDGRVDPALDGLDSSRLPSHVAVIMDGNGRWARTRGFRDRTRGHQAAIEAVRETTRTAAELGIRVLTLFAFSTENWTRPRAEVSFLMRLFERVLVHERAELMKNNVRVSHLGFTEGLPQYVRRALDATLTLTAGNDGLVLNLALNYGGRAEIVEAARALCREAAEGRLRPENVDAGAFQRCLRHPELGDPDLLIRTSGEMRISNFLLWQLAYAEIYVTPTLWPDFRRADFIEALAAYQKRERRFGAIG